MKKLQTLITPKFKGVPTVFIDEKVIVGYDRDIGQKIEEYINKCVREGCISPDDVLNGKSGHISIEKGNFSGYEKTQEGLALFIIMIILFVVLLSSIILIKRKGGVKK